MAEEPPKPKNYLVKIFGGFTIQVAAENPEYAKGLAVGQLNARVPQFQVTQVTVEEQ